MCGSRDSWHTRPHTSQAQLLVESDLRFERNRQCGPPCHPSRGRTASRSTGNFPHNRRRERSCAALPSSRVHVADPSPGPYRLVGYCGSASGALFARTPPRPLTVDLRTAFLSLLLWEAAQARRDSNPHFAELESAALPVELRTSGGNPLAVGELGYYWDDHVSTTLRGGSDNQSGDANGRDRPAHLPNGTSIP
jgi:hypothetical protein